MDGGALTAVWMFLLHTGRINRFDYSAGWPVDSVKHSWRICVAAQKQTAFRVKGEDLRLTRKSFRKTTEKGDEGSALMLKAPQ